MISVTQSLDSVQTQNRLVYQELGGVLDGRHPLDNLHCRQSFESIPLIGQPVNPLVSYGLLYKLLNRLQNSKTNYDHSHLAMFAKHSKFKIAELKDFMVSEL